MKVIVTKDDFGAVVWKADAKITLVDCPSIFGNPDVDNNPPKAWKNTKLRFFRDKDRMFQPKQVLKMFPGLTETLFNHTKTEAYLEIELP